MTFPLLLSPKTTLAQTTVETNTGSLHSDNHASTSPAVEEVLKTLEQLEPYVSTKSKELDFESAKSNPLVDNNILSEYSAALVSQGWNVKASESDLITIQSQASEVLPTMTALRNSCEGRNGFEAIPPAILLDSCAATAVQNAYNSGAGVAAIAALLTAQTGVGPLLAGAIAGALATQSGIVGLCNSWGHGVKLFPGGACWSQ
ncbi:hypothetical protein J5O04_05110 [Corynebacterium hindlerae]|uniref:hypothetical protein n=1 Tax=Corynebacterium hindlerae TaxID=699041 RepID=UPI001AD64E84|nr:hypothetical protein [Corynebacterium hindlerae]QTH60493.1 hypothetical protein J5O04_05110 [Corynebacterium hindlerae]